MKKLITLLMLLSIIACGQTANDKEARKIQTNFDWKIFEKSEYSIQYPSTWELNQSGQNGISFILLSKLDSAHDNFRENITLLIQNLSGANIDLNKYTEISENQIKTLATNSTLIESVRLKNEGLEFQKVIYTADQGIFHLKFEQYYWVVNEKAYVLTFSAKQDAFNSYKDVSEKILNSFKIKK